MALEFEFEVGKGFLFVPAFASHFNLPVIHDEVFLPPYLGEGRIKEIYLLHGMDLCMQRYYLKQALILRRLPSPPNDIITIKFDGKRKISPDGDNHPHKPLLSSSGYAVEIATSNFLAEISLPAGQQINFLIVSIPRPALLSMLQFNGEDHFIGSTLKEGRSFVLHEAMTPEMERILDEISLVNSSNKLAALYCQTKAQELIYMLFIRLLGRTSIIANPINPDDAKRIYAVRNSILQDFSNAPQLPALAKNAGLSLTRMKLLFRQVFGDSIYNYYQSARMQEASLLLEKLTVSETGYQLGFTNLSHFSRLFEKHNRLKPKKYKDSI